jgi:translation initiation factor IF-2
MILKKENLREQRATRRLKDETGTKDKKLKPGTNKREVKLTVSRALNVEEIEIKQRSLASVKRARLKEKRNSE